MSKNTTIVLLIILIVILVGVYFSIQPKQNQPALNQQGGVKVEILQQGSGPAAKAGDTVTVNYVGTLQNGTKFDSSIDRGQPFQFTLGQNRVIQGWELGVAGMKVAEKRKLTIPPELAYGAQGAGAAIPPNSTLIFEIDMLGINGIK